MSLDILKTAEIIENLESFIDFHRPEESIRDQVDLDYKFEGQSIIIYEIRPHYETGEAIESPIAKTTYVKSRDEWKIYWMRGNLKWFPYKPHTVRTLNEVLDIVDEDHYGCFWGYTTHSLVTRP